MKIEVTWQFVKQHKEVLWPPILSLLFLPKRSLIFKLKLNIVLKLGKGIRSGDVAQPYYI